MQRKNYMSEYERSHFISRVMNAIKANFIWSLPWLRLLSSKKGWAIRTATGSYNYRDITTTETALADLRRQKGVLYSGILFYAVIAKIWREWFSHHTRRFLWSLRWMLISLFTMATVAKEIHRSYCSDQMKTSLNWAMPQFAHLVKYYPEFFKFVVCNRAILSILSNPCYFMVNDHFFGIFLCWQTIIRNISSNLKAMLYVAKLTQNTAQQHAIPCHFNDITCHVHLLVTN